MPNLIGFDGPGPFSIIVWQLNGEDKSKTVCYSDEEEKEALSRFFTPGDYYTNYDKAQVIRSDNQVFQH